MNPEAGALDRGCRHCRLPLVAGSGPFCCTGCAFVHGLLGRGEGDDSPRASTPLLGRLAVCAVLGMGVMVASVTLYGVDAAADDASGRALQGVFRMGALLLSLPVLLLLGFPLLDTVVSQRRFLGADALILLGVGAAFGLSTWAVVTDSGRVYFETATGVLVLVTLGRFLDVRAREHAAEALGRLTGAHVRPALRVRGNDETEVAPESLVVGDEVSVRAGEASPVDGVIVAGRALVDRSPLSGEAAPVPLGSGDILHAGCRPVDGSLRVRATSAVGSRVCDEIERHLGEATGRRAELVRLADRVSAAFLPLVAVVALGASGWHGWRHGAEQGVLVGLAVVLIACPCALGLATPLAFWVALGEAWRRGVLVRGADVFERLARVRRVAFDKTGTLTTGSLELARIRLEQGQETNEVLGLAAALERHVRHPIGTALEAEARARGLVQLPTVEDVRCVPGAGLRGTYRGRALTLGRPDSTCTDATAAELCLDGTRLALFELEPRLRPEAAGALAELRRLGLAAVVLTGDSAAPAALLAGRLGLPVEANLLPLDKVERLAVGGRSGVLFVGDGLNDAPALAAADVGVAMRSASTISLESASVNLLGDDLGALPRLISLSRRAVAVARGNLLWAFAYNSVGIVLAAAGWLSPLFAASAMVASSGFVVWNSLRLATTPPTRADGVAPPTPRPRLQLSTGD